MHIYFVFCLIHCLCFFPCLFTSPQTFSLPSPSPPFYMSISASTQHLHSCSEDKVLGDKGVKRSEHAWKAERVKWNWGDGQGRDEGLGGGVWWKANGWRETKYNTYMNNSSGLLFYLFSNFFQIVLSSSMFNLLSKNRTKLSSSFSLNFQFSLE